MILRKLLGLVAPYIAWILSGCAIPATEVVVPTESMRAALEHIQDTPPPAFDQQLSRTARAAAPPGAPLPTIAAPDVRMAYLYEWIDVEGNKHFGHWVAIPLHGFDWVMPGGASVPMGPHAGGTDDVGPSR